MLITLDLPHRDKRRKPIVCEIKDNNCWECKSHYSDRIHHPRFNVLGEKTTIHRYLYMLCHGPIHSPKLVVRHTCDNMKCLNPAHLILGTQYDNIEDMVIRGRGVKGSKVAGAKLTEEQVKEIRSLKKTSREIADKYNIQPATVVSIKNYKSWKHI